MKSRIRAAADALAHRIAGVASRQLSSSFKNLENMMMLQGRTLAEINATRTDIRSLHDVEFKVFSQYGEDGILQHLIRQTHILPSEQIFVEFGVQDYLESNTRFLLQGCQWRGLIIDGSREYMESVRRSDLYWRNDLTALDAWIDRDNINDLIGGAGFAGDIGILSVDIDGNDYWVWEQIEVVNPVIVVLEWNSVFGPDHPVSVPYDPAFSRPEAHYSCLYWGASMGAFESLGKSKGYSLLGSNRVGNNIFFVRNDRLGDLKPVTTSEAWLESRFRDSRDASGQLDFKSGPARKEVIKDLPLIDVRSGQTISLAELEEKENLR